MTKICTRINKIYNYIVYYIGRVLHLSRCIIFTSGQIRYCFSLVETEQSYQSTGGRADLYNIKISIGTVSTKEKQSPIYPLVKIMQRERCNSRPVESSLTKRADLFCAKYISSKIFLMNFLPFVLFESQARGLPVEAEERASLCFLSAISNETNAVDFGTH